MTVQADFSNQIFNGSYVQRWYSVLPTDMAAQLGQPVDFDDDLCGQMMKDIQNSSSSKMASVLKKHGTILLKIGRPARVRILAKISMWHFETLNDILKKLLDKDGDDGGKTSDDGNTPTVADLFRQDIDAIRGFVFQRKVASVKSKVIADTLSNSARILVENFGPSRSGM